MNKTFRDNYLTIKKCFPGEYSNRHALGAFLCMVNDEEHKRVISRERILECKKILSSKVNISASFRDHLKLPLVIKMALSDDPEKYLSGMAETFNSIKETYFTGSGQRFVTAMAIYDNCHGESVTEYCGIMYEIFELMKDKHPLLTGQEDMMFAGLLAIDNEQRDEVLEEMETCYHLLRNRFKLSRNAIQSVSHVMALTDHEPQDKTEKFIELYELLKDNKSRLGMGPQLIVLSVLSVLDVALEDCVEEVLSTDEYLKEIKGFGKLGIDNKERRMIATALTAAAHLESNDNIVRDVKTSLLRTVLSTAMIGGMIITRSSREMAAHR